MGFFNTSRTQIAVRISSFLLTCQIVKPVYLSTSDEINVAFFLEIGTGQLGKGSPTKWTSSTSFWTAITAAAVADTPVKFLLKLVTKTLGNDIHTFL